MDWLFGVGYGKLEESNNRNEFESQTNNVETIESHSGILWTIAPSFYLTEVFSVRFYLTGMHYKALSAEQSTSTEIWYSNFDASLSLGMRF